VIVPWSDGSRGQALAYFADEILVSEDDISGARHRGCRPCTSRATASTCTATADRLKSS
jgi:hypothetical protein